MNRVVLRAVVVVGLAALASAAEPAKDVPFFFNNVTGESTWTRPPAMPLFDASGRPYWVVGGVASWEPANPADNWAPHTSPDGDTYFVNGAGETSWERPAVLGWSVRSNSSFFWYNSVTHATQHERPAVMGHHSEAHNATYYETAGGKDVTWDPPEDAAWRRVKDPDSGVEFFHNDVSKESTWDLPAVSSLAWAVWHTEVEDLR